MILTKQNSTAMSNYSDNEIDETVHVNVEGDVAEITCPRCYGHGDIYDKKLDEDVPCEYCDGYGTLIDD